MASLDSHFRLSKGGKVRLATHKCVTNAERAEFRRFLVLGELGEKRAKAVLATEKAMGE